MSSLHRSPTSTSSLAATPAVSTSPSAPAAGLAVPQHTGNAAAQETAGTTAAPPAPASCFDEALDTLGDMASVVLDALPLPQAIPLAWGRRSQPWAARWLRDQPGAVLLDAAGGLIDDAFDVAWPVGLGFGLDGVLAAQVFAEFSADGRFFAERGADGVRVRFAGVISKALAAGLGPKLAGAEDVATLAMQAEAKFSDLVGVETEWRLAVPDLLRALVELSPAGMHALLWGAKKPVDLLTGPLTRLLRSVRPVRARLSEDVRLELAGEATPLVAGLAVRQSTTAGYGFGADEQGCFAEFHLGQSSEGSWVHRLFSALGLPASLTTNVGGDVCVRVRGAEDAVRDLNVAALSFEVCCTSREGHVTRADTVHFDTAAELAAHLLALANPLDGLVGEEGTPVPAAELPARTLTRGVQRNVDNVRALADDVPAVAELVDDFVGDLLEPADGAMEGGVLDFDLEAELGGQVAVPIEAVRAAVHEEPLAPGPAGIEARVLDVERAIAADAVGGGRFETGIPDLDLGAAAEHVDLGKVELVLRAELHAGAGGGLKIGIITGGKVGAGATVSKRHTLGTLTPADRRAVLGDAR